MDTLFWSFYSRVERILDNEELDVSEEQQEVCIDCAVTAVFTRMEEKG